MKGISSALISIALVLITASTVSVLYTQIRSISRGAISSGSAQLINAKIAPKLLSAVCFPGYGYMKVSSDEPLSGKVYYEVESGTELISSGYASVNVTDVGNIYFNATLPPESEYKVMIVSKYWSLMEKCTSGQDPGLTVFLPFNETNPNSTTAFDWSLNGNNAVVNASWVNGTSNYALRFNGTNQGAVIPSNGFDTRDFAVAFWIIRENSDANNEAIVESDSFSVKSMSNGNVRFSVTGGASVDLSLFNLQWTHLIMSFRDNQISVFSNCSLTNITASGHSPASSNIKLGNSSAGNFTGAIDEFYFFSRGLEPSEVPLFCQGSFSVQGNAYNGTWSGECNPSIPGDCDVI